MKVLLDTHAFLWWIADSARLSVRAHEIISDGDNELYISAVTGWEIAVKARLGRIELPDDPQRFIPDQMRMNAMQGLPVQMSHALQVFALPHYHRDPFDRMLVAQAQIEGLPILTADPQIGLYQVEVIW